MVTKNVWMSYDLGIQGDYNHLYAWLDNHGAIECGDSMAFFKYVIPQKMEDPEFLDYIRADLEKSISFKPGDRVYLIRFDPKDNTYYGKFIIGKRKASPWEGYGDSDDNNSDDGLE